MHVQYSSCFLKAEIEVGGKPDHNIFSFLHTFFPGNSELTFTTYANRAFFGGRTTLTKSASAAESCLDSSSTRAITVLTASTRSATTAGRRWCPGAGCAVSATNRCKETLQFELLAVELAL